MRLEFLHIKNLKWIRDMQLTDIENALILVGKNSSGKSSLLKVIRAMAGDYHFQKEDFNEKGQNIEVMAKLRLDSGDLKLFYEKGFVSQYRKFEAWKRDFMEKIPSYQDGVVTFSYIANRNGNVRYEDGIKKHNKYIKRIFPKVYFMDTSQDLLQLQEEILMFQEDDILKKIRGNCCIFNQARICSGCFQCIGFIEKKTPAQLNAFETSKLLEYKLFQMNLDGFSKRVNYYFHRNGGFPQQVRYGIGYDTKEIFQVKGEIFDPRRNQTSDMSVLGKGMQRIYMLSLLEAYVQEKGRISSMILMEDPETFLHPGLQKVASQILYGLSKKNQVVFTTHSPHLLYNFNSRQIRQVYQDKDFYTAVREKTDIDMILNDLGYTANDFLNANFVFIVEGKQDKSRLPLLLQQYYGELQDAKGDLSRISIITTNSCTNIKTYANLKYMNKVYLKDQFLMIRDSDGKNPRELAGQLCQYYQERNTEDVDKLPRVTPQNVLILKYYSFENYFLNPVIMTKLGIVESPEDFYHRLFLKWKEYLHRIASGRHLIEILGKDITSVEELKENMEPFKIYMRGHNLFDIFYGSYRSQEQKILKEYIALAPREDFADILDHIEKFSYFENRKK